MLSFPPSRPAGDVRRRNFVTLHTGGTFSVKRHVFSLRAGALLLQTCPPLSSFLFPSLPRDTNPFPPVTTLFFLNQSVLLSPSRRFPSAPKRRAPGAAPFSKGQPGPCSCATFFFCLASCRISRRGSVSVREVFLFSSGRAFFLRSLFLSPIASPSFYVRSSFFRSGKETWALESPSREHPSLLRGESP